MPIDRRTLITRSCLAAASMAGVSRWAAAGKLRIGMPRRAAADSDTVLVVVQMGGGNDGLNMIVPFGDPAYARARSRIALAPSQTLPLDGRNGLHPSLANLHGYLQAGKLAIVQGVGYPRPDMSHFRSDDIWEKASTEPELTPTGWLGRVLDQLYGKDPQHLHGVSFAGDVTALHADSVTSPVVGDSNSFNYPHDDPGETSALLAMLAPSGGIANRDYVAEIGRLAIADSDAVQRGYAAYTSTVTYPDGLATVLRQVAMAIFADLGPRLYFVSQGGYDTHSSQLGDQARLLAELDDSLDAFYRDLVEHGYDGRVIVMTYSEFGRRVEDNGSGGTDHGSAGPMFVFGTRVRGGLYGTPPSLTDLDPDGNLKFLTDFRQVYASVLANWIDADPVPILSGKYATVPFL